MKNYEQIHGWLPSRRSGPRGANHGTQDTSRDPKMSPTDPKTSKLWPRGSQNGAPEPSGLPKWSLEELQKPKNEATVQANNTQDSLRIRNLLKLAQVFTIIATAIITLLPMFASTLLRPPIFSVKMSACPFLSESSWSSHFSLGW